MNSLRERSFFEFLEIGLPTELYRELPKEVFFFSFSVSVTDDEDP
jgi:hypothetical protein